MIGCEGVYSIYLGHNRDNGWAVVQMVITLRIK
jgi:hypothetical protein